MKTRALLLALPLLALGLSGCRDNRASISIEAICSMPTNGCTFSGKCDTEYLGFPTVDAGKTSHLWLVIQVENRLASNADAGLNRLNTNDAHVTEFVVSYDGLALPKQVMGAQFSVPAGTQAVVSVEVIPTSMAAGALLLGYATATGREMMATLRMKGYFDDGSNFETGDFPIAIKVCNGCVPNCTTITDTCPPSSNGQLPLGCL